MVYVVYKFPGETQIAKVAGEASWRKNRQWHQSGKPFLIEHVTVEIQTYI